MTHDEFIDLIDLYLKNKLSDEARRAFIEAIKVDVDKMVETEVIRAAAIKTHTDEKLALMNRFNKEYSSTSVDEEGKIIPLFSEERDNAFMKMMNAAFAKNIDLLENDETVIDWDTILKFLEGEDED